MVDMSVQSSNKVYRVSDDSRNTFNVNHEVGAEVYSCECKLYSRLGILCSHVFFVFKNTNVHQIPEQYFGSRWLKRPLLKAVHGFPIDEFDMTEGTFIFICDALISLLNCIDIF